ncbi:MAG: cytochrome c [Planctomycetes bacterium]|nr:cytochrome c [Planctomycetota bacterium]
MSKTRNGTIAFWCLCAAALVVAVVGGSVIAQVTQGKTRPMKTSHWMAGVMKTSSGALRKGLSSTPADDKAWKQLEISAALLNEASYVLMADGRCPDAVWANAVEKTLREGSASLLKAIEAKDVAAAKTALSATTKSCKECHTKHRS